MNSGGSLEKADWLACLGHEIRSPLTGLLAFIDLLDGDSLSEEEKADCLKRMRSSCRSLNDLATRVLDLTRLERGIAEVEIAPTALRERILDAVDGWRAEAAQRGVILTVEFAPDFPSTLDTDALRLWQVLNNLLSNALKHTRTGEVRVTAAIAPQRVQIDVDDTGAGIDDALQMVLFEPFQRGASSDTAGTGLGLALARGYCRALGGELVLVASQRGAGSRFRISLPLRVN